MKLFYLICAVITFVSIMFLRQATSHSEVYVWMTVITIVFISLISVIIVRDHMEEV